MISPRRDLVPSWGRDVAAEPVAVQLPSSAQRAAEDQAPPRVTTLTAPAAIRLAYAQRAATTVH